MSPRRCKCDFSPNGVRGEQEYLQARVVLGIVNSDDP